MSHGPWRLTALEFAVLWERLGRDRLPYPFGFRGTAETDTQFRDQRADAARRVLAQVDAPMYEALAALAEPVVRIELCGLHRCGAGSSMVRVHAGIRHARATVAVQRPGADLHTGADVVLTAVAPVEVGVALAQTIPRVEAGRRRGVSVPRSTAPGASVMRPAGRRRASEQRGEFFARPRTGFGEVSVVAGPAYDSTPRGDDRCFHWVDFAGDGRYLVRGTETVRARPAGGTDIAALVQRLVAEAGAARAVRLPH